MGRMPSLFLLQLQLLLLLVHIYMHASMILTMVINSMQFCSAANDTHIPDKNTRLRKSLKNFLNISLKTTMMTTTNTTTTANTTLGKTCKTRIPTISHGNKNTVLWTWKLIQSHKHTHSYTFSIVGRLSGTSVPI